MDYTKIVQDVIDDHKDFPIDILGIGIAESEYTYLKFHRDSYIRTIREVDSLLKNDRSNKHILEIGSFLGPVSISLRKMGYFVSALDIPEFQESASLKSLYKKNEIPFTGMNLRNYKLPYESNSFDLVIICEVIEHLNFNPLPVLKEINRILKINGYIYIGMPNQARIQNRFKMFFGKSIHDPIESFFKQLDRNYNMIVGLHWREYTLIETQQLVEKMGFETVNKYYFLERGYWNANILKNILKIIIFTYPPFRPYHVIVGKKVSTPVYDFWLTAANS